MKKFTTIDDIADLSALLDSIKAVKARPLANSSGTDKTLCLLFFNPSLRTRLSTQKAAHNLGMHTIVMNLGNEGWTLEFEDGAVMDGHSAEHIKEAARVVSQYCDILAIRSFPTLTNQQLDEQDHVLSAFVKYATVPVVSLEGAIEHPLQALADAITIETHKKRARPKVVLTWAPHPRALPHAVPNSFIKIMKRCDVDLVLTYPEGYALHPELTAGVTTTHDQDEAFAQADFIYAKNWSSYEAYGKILSTDPSWIVTAEKMALTNRAQFMHCLPVRRNVIATDEVLDGQDAIIIELANNRTFATQAILAQILADNER